MERSPVGEHCIVDILRWPEHWNDEVDRTSPARQHGLDGLFKFQSIRTKDCRGMRALDEHENWGVLNAELDHWRCRCVELHLVESDIWIVIRHLVDFWRRRSADGTRFDFYVYDRWRPSFRPLHGSVIF